MVEETKITNTSEDKHLFTWTPEKETTESASSVTSKTTQGNSNLPAKEQPIKDDKSVNSAQVEKTPVVIPKTSTQPSEKDVSLENDLEELISAAWPKPTDTKKVDFGVSEDIEKKETNKQKIIKEKKMPQRIANNLALLVLLCLVLFVVGLFYAFLRYKDSQTIPTSLEKYMPQVEKAYYWARELLWYPVPSTYPENNLVPKWTWSNAVAEIIDDSRLDYISKKDILGKWVVHLYTETSNKYDQYEELKKTISQQWFFPVELQKLSEGWWFNNSIQKGIISIESVRFATALNFFSSLNSFMTQLSAITSVSQDKLSEMIDVFIKRWEKDINNYVVSCYLNGYETSTTCTTIWDFSKYYSIYPTTGFDQRVFLATMKLIQDKLENSDVPSLDISMKSINPLENTINLSIEINTIKNDEDELSKKKKILNPHIYLVTSIINNLRESRYVLTDAINISSLKVNKKKIKVGWETYVVNSSSFSFQLPLQSNVQREIYDFTDMGQKNISNLINPKIENSIAPQDNINLNTIWQESSTLPTARENPTIDRWDLRDYAEKEPSRDIWTPDGPIE